MKKNFSVGIVGQFRVGKSTFINTLLGEEVLPTDVLPTTATLSRITYGIKRSAKIIFKDGKEEQIPIEMLADYVTKLTDESEKTAASVKEAVIYYPLSYCQNNDIEIIDTPGLNDESSMTEVTLSALSQVDAAIMVILGQHPFGEFEKAFLEDKLLKADLGRVIFVVNLWDSYTPENAHRLIYGSKGIKARIQQYVLDKAANRLGENSEDFKVYKQKIGEPKVFGVYTMKALQAKQKGDEVLLAQSGFQEFETALKSFLANERGVILLQVPVNRAIASSKEIISAISIEEGALKMKQEELQAAYEKSMTEINAVRERQKKELKFIDAAAAKVKLLVRPLIYKLPDELKQAAEEAIQSTPIEPKELNNKNALAEKLSDQVSETLKRTAEQLSQKIQNEIQQGIDQEIERLKDFSKSVDLALTNIEMQFIEIQGSTDHRNTNRAMESITAALSVFTGFGGIWSGYRVAGLKGAATGGVASVGTVVLGSMIAVVMGVNPLTWPVLVAMGVATIFTGGGLTKMIFKGDLVANFRADFTEKVKQEIEKQAQNQQLVGEIDKKITAPFEELKQTLIQEVELFLDNTEKTISELHGKRGRNEAMNEKTAKNSMKFGLKPRRFLVMPSGYSISL